jgi:hypothetical protein
MKMTPNIELIVRDEYQKHRHIGDFRAFPASYEVKLHASHVYFQCACGDELRASVGWEARDNQTINQTLAVIKIQIQEHAFTAIGRKLCCLLND